jgi:hypothetical protein
MFRGFVFSPGLVYLGPSGRVKLAPKTPKVTDDAKEVSVGGLDHSVHPNFIIPEQAGLKDFKDHYYHRKNPVKARC